MRALLKRIPGARSLARRLGLVTQGVWLFRREVLGWTSDAGIVEQLPTAHRLFARYASAYFRHRDGDTLPAGRLVFQGLAALHHLITRQDLAQIEVGPYAIFVDVKDARLLHVVNELSGSGETSALAQLLAPGDTFIDIGSNHGAFAVVASTIVGSRGQVVAVEPQPRLAEAIQKSLSLISPARFVVLPLAMGDREGTIDLLIPRGYSGTAGLFRSHSGTHPHRRVEVPLRRFDDAVDWRALPGSVFVKLDVEGSEFAFLRGAQEMIRARRPTILMEVNQDSLSASDTSASSLLQLLADLGYTSFADVGEPSERIPLPALDPESYGDRNVLLFHTSEPQATLRPPQ